MSVPEHHHRRRAELSIGRDDRHFACCDAHDHADTRRPAAALRPANARIRCGPRRAHGHTTAARCAPARHAEHAAGQGCGRRTTDCHRLDVAFGVDRHPRGGGAVAMPGGERGRACAHGRHASRSKRARGIARFTRRPVEPSQAPFPRLLEHGASARSSATRA